MKQTVDAIHAKLLVVIIPDEIQINKTLQTQVREDEKISWDQDNITLPQRILKTFFDQHNINYIDLLQTWQASSAAEMHYLPRNTHLNNEGNQSVAEILYPKIFELLQHK
jgi:lysophospholipase L1-like esterase